MSVTYPLAIVNTASITSLVRVTLFHHSTSGRCAQIETSEGVAGSGGTARNAAAENPATQGVSDILGVRSVEYPLAVEEAMTAKIKVKG